MDLILGPPEQSQCKNCPIVALTRHGSNESTNFGGYSKPRMKKAEQRFLDKEGLRAKLNLVSTRQVDELMQNKRIPFLRLGHRTVRFDWPKVEKALARFEVKEAA